MASTLYKHLLFACALSAAVGPRPSMAKAPEPAVREPERAAVEPGLSDQQKRMLGLAGELAKRCAETLERWVAKGEVSEERLLAGLYYPIGDTDPPKFRTDWDKLSDRDILPLEEAVLAKSAALNFAVLVDSHGYLPTHNQRHSLPLTGDKASDLIGNRTKRIYADRTGLASARSELPYLIQRYHQDSGDSLEELSVPVVVRGKKWGAVRLGYRVVEGE